MTDITEILTANLGLSTTSTAKKLTRAIATTTDNRKQQYIAISGSRSLSSSTSSKIPEFDVGI